MKNDSTGDIDESVLMFNESLKAVVNKALLSRARRGLHATAGGLAISAHAVYI